MIARGYDRNVFINCPFDSVYRPLFEAIAFATADCGYHPRSALEVNDSSQVRIEKITGIISESRLAVHDISRTQFDRGTRLPRFNMPLELGIFLGAKSFGSGDHKRKVAIILDTDRYRYQKFISDIAGQDIRAHGGRIDEAIHEVRDFLSTYREAGVFLPGGDKIVERYRLFVADLPTTCRKLHLDLDRLNFRDLSSLIFTWLRGTPWSPWRPKRDRPAEGFRMGPPPISHRPDRFALEACSPRKARIASKRTPTGRVI